MLHIDDISAAESESACGASTRIDGRVGWLEWDEFGRWSASDKSARAGSRCAPTVGEGCGGGKVRERTALPRLAFLGRCLFVDRNRLARRLSGVCWAAGAMRHLCVAYASGPPSSWGHYFGNELTYGANKGMERGRFNIDGRR